MNWAKGLAIIALSALLVVAAYAQSPSGPRPRFVNIAQANSQKNPNRPNANKGARPGRRLGDWLRDHRNLPLDQQEKLLEKDPAFKNLPPERQAELKERLRNFNRLPPAQQQRVLNRIDFMESLTPQQREQIRESNQQLQGLPQDRQLMVHKALRHLRAMDPQQRDEVMNSPRFKGMFSDQERGILSKLAAINPPEEGNPNPNQQQGPPKEAPK